MNMDNTLLKPIAQLALATGVLLSIPLVAMQFSNDVVWTLSDFMVAGTLLFGTGFIYILVTRILAPRMGDNIIYRVAVAFALFTGLFLIWVNLAVGIVGSEENPANLMYFGVIAVGIIGTFIARFKPQGMAYVMFAMALSQALVTIIVLAGGMYQSPPSTVFHIIGVNGFFIVLYAVSALAFHYVVQKQPPLNAGSEQ